MAHRHMRVVAPDTVDAEADKVRHVEPAIDAPQDPLRAGRARLEVEVAPPHGRPPSDPAARGSGGASPDLARGIGVAKEVTEHALLERDVAPRPLALAVERPRAEAARAPALVDQGDERRGHPLADPVLQESRVAENSVSR